MQFPTQPGDLVLPEYQNIDQVFATLVDKTKIGGKAGMATFMIDGEIGGLMVVAPMQQLIRLSRLVATVASSPIINMGDN